MQQLACARYLRRLNPLTRTYRARFTLIDAPAGIKLGMTVTLSLDESDSTGTLDIPASSIIRQQNQSAVWRVEQDGSVTAVPVEIAQYSTESVRISSGLKVGDRIVSAGAHKVDANVRVRTWRCKNECSEEFQSFPMGRHSPAFVLFLILASGVAA